MDRTMPMKVRKGYVIRYEQDAEGWWVAEIRGVPGCYTQGRTIEQARSRIVEALSALLDTDVSNVEFEDDVHLPNSAQKALSLAREAMEKAEAEMKRAEAARVNAVQALTGSGLSTRDVGRLLGVTRQRAHQLSQMGRQGRSQSRRSNA